MSGCARCARQWTGHSTCHCGACHRTFTSLSAFDAHQTLVRDVSGVRCSDPAGMYRKSGKPVFSWNVNREMWSLWSDGPNPFTGGAS